MATDRLDGNPVTKGFVWGLAVLSLAGGLAAAQGPSGVDAAEFRYLHGFDAAGDFAGSCGLAGFHFNPDAPGELGLTTSGGRLIVYETWWNETIVLPGTAASHHVVAPMEQYALERRVPGGGVTLAWDAHAHVLLAEETRDGRGELSARLAGSRWSSGPPDRSFPLGVTYHEPEPDPDPLTDDVVELGQVVYGPARRVATNALLVSADGDGFVKMDGVHVTWDGFDLQLPPHRQVVRQDHMGGVVLRTLLETHAVLWLEDLDTRLDPGAGELYCSRLDWSGVGGVTYRTSVGEARRGEETVRFERQEFTVSGEFESRESIETSEELGARHYLVAASEGRFDAVGVDFAWVGSVGGVLDAAQAVQAGLVALVLGGLAWVASHLSRVVAFFYSRVGVDRALEHPVRSFIYGATRERPGLILRDLVEATQRRYGVVRHHASVLAHLGLVTTLRHGKALHVYPAGTSIPSARRSLLVERDAPVRFLVGLVAAAPRSTREILRAVQDRFGFSRPGTWKVLWRAERVGLVERRVGPEGVVVCKRAYS